MKFYKIIYVFMLAVFTLAACSAEDENTETATAAESSDEITITDEQFAKAKMQLGKIVEKTFSEKIRTTGMLDVPPKYKASVSVYYGGIVKEVDLLAGQKVKKGERLFTLENPDYIQMQQDYLNAKSKLNYLKAEYERQKNLLRENVSSQKIFAKVKSEYFTVLSDYNALGKKLRLLNVNPETLDYDSITSVAVITAPITGYVTQVNITKGEFLSPNETAVSIVGTEHMHLELDVFEKDIAKIKKGQPVKFSFPDNPSKFYDAEIFLAGKSVSSENRTVNVHGHLKNEYPNASFLPGMYIEAEISVDEIASAALPSEAIVNVDDQNYVLVEKARSNGKYVFVKRKVEIGKSNDGYTQILNADIFENASVLVKGAFNLIQ